MIIYYVFPVIVFIFYILSNSNLNNNKNIPFFLYGLLFLFLVIFAGFRGETVSRDYQSYILFFNQIIDGQSVSVINDPGFTFISWIASFLSNTYIYLFIIYAIIGVSVKLFSFYKILGIRHSFLGVIIYFSNFYFLHEMTQIRIGVATGIFLISIQFIINRQFIKFLICIAIAAFFHVSILLVLPLYFLKFKSINPIFWWVLHVANIIFFLFRLSLLDLIQVFTPDSLTSKVEILKLIMIESVGTTNIRIFNRFLMYLILNLFLLYHWKLLAQKSKYFIFLLKASFISLSLAFFLYDSYVFAYRFSEIIGVVQICLFAMIAFLFNNRVVGAVIVLLLALFLILINIGFTGLLQSYYFNSI